MPSLGDYVDMTSAQAARQWTELVRRGPRPTTKGWRQVDFVPVETVLCLAASLSVNHRRFGGRTSHVAPSPVPELAALFRRTPASILAKMANLDGSRPNGAQHEVETAATLLGDPTRLAHLYLTVMKGARAAGVTRSQLPDFLGLEQGEAFELLGQEELAGEDLETAVEPRLRSLAGQMGDTPDQVTERLLTAAARVGQHRFAADVLHNCGRRCVFCGLVPGRRLDRSGLLIASHIKPWRSSTDRERLDPTNGLSACPNHDRAFDKGHLWIGDDLAIHPSEPLREASLRDDGMNAAFGQPPIRPQLQLPADAARPGDHYLRWHRDNLAVTNGPTHDRP